MFYCTLDISECVQNSDAEFIRNHSLSIDCKKKFPVKLSRIDADTRLQCIQWLRNEAFKFD